MHEVDQDVVVMYTLVKMLFYVFEIYKSLWGFWGFLRVFKGFWGFWVLRVLKVFLCIFRYVYIILLNFYFI